MDNDTKQVEAKLNNDFLESIFFMGIFGLLFLATTLINGTAIFFIWNWFLPSVNVHPIEYIPACGLSILVLLLTMPMRRSLFNISMSPMIPMGIRIRIILDKAVKDNLLTLILLGLAYLFSLLL